MNIGNVLNRVYNMNNNIFLYTCVSLIATTIYETKNETHDILDFFPVELGFIFCYKNGCYIYRNMPWRDCKASLAIKNHILLDIFVIYIDVEHYGKWNK